MLEHNERNLVDRYLRAAQAGDLNAMNAVGNLYYNGEMVARNYRPAFKWYKAAGYSRSVPVIKLGGDD